MIGLSGCMNFFKGVEVPIAEHLREKYGIEFTGFTSDLSSGDVVHCYPVGGDPDTDNVRVYTTKHKGSERTFQDTYFNIIIRKDVEAEVYAACEGLPLPMKVYFTGTSYFDNIWDGTKTYADLKQWINEGNSKGLDVTIAIPMDGTDNVEKEEYANQVFDRIEKSGHSGLVHICFFPNEAFEKVTRSLTDRNNLASQYKDEYAIFSNSIN